MYRSKETTNKNVQFQRAEQENIVNLVNVVRTQFQNLYFFLSVREIKKEEEKNLEKMTKHKLRRISNSQKDSSFKNPFPSPPPKKNDD